MVFDAQRLNSPAGAAFAQVRWNDGLGGCLTEERNDMHTFLRADGKVIHSDTFMRVPLERRVGRQNVKRSDDV